MIYQPKKILYLFFALLSTQQVFADNSISVVRPPVSEVRVFMNGATVNRSAHVNLPSGQSEVRFENLSAGINPSSVSVSGSGDFTILSVNQQLDYLSAEKKTPQIIELEDSLLALKRTSDDIQNQISVYTEEQNLLLANKAAGGTNVGAKAEDVKNLANFFRERMMDLKKRILDLNAKQTKLKLVIDKVNNQLGTLNILKEQPSSTIVVNVLCSAGLKAGFNISYFTSNAGWVPQYEIKVKDASSPVDLLYKAMVSQSTGEDDWKDVKIKISTGNPVLGGNKPELYPWYLNFLGPVYQREERMKVAAPAMMGGNAPSAMERKDAIQMDEYITVSESQLATDYEIGIPYTIPTDGKKYAVDLRNYSLNATYQYYAVPKIDHDAFLVASVSGFEGLDLQPGKANIFYENGFVGESQLNPKITEDTLQISLGRDKRIVIKREKIKDVSGNKILGGNRTQVFTYEISVKNSRKDAINITIEDQLPVSQDLAIEVKALELSDGILKPEDGKISWKLAIPPGQLVKKQLSFSVKHPKDKIINGL